MTEHENQTLSKSLVCPAGLLSTGCLSHTAQSPYHPNIDQITAVST